MPRLKIVYINLSIGHRTTGEIYQTSCTNPVLSLNFYLHLPSTMRFFSFSVLAGAALMVVNLDGAQANGNFTLHPRTKEASQWGGKVEIGQLHTSKNSTQPTWKDDDQKLDSAHDHSTPWISASHREFSAVCCYGPFFESVGCYIQKPKSKGTSCLGISQRPPAP